MNGEPFCYGTRLTVRNILELRSAGYTLAADAQGPPRAPAHGRRRGVRVRRRATATGTPTSSSRTARSRGPGYSEAEADGLPSQYRIPGVVIKSG